MKKLTVIVVAALVAILVAAAPARADLFPRVPFDFTPTDGGRTPGGESAPGGWVPDPELDTAFKIGDEERVLLDTDSVDTTAGSPDIGTQDMPTGRLTGLMYNAQLVDINQISASQFELFYGQSLRNPLPGTPGGAGGVIEMYEDSSIGAAEDEESEYFNHGGDGLAPFDWSEGTGGSRDTFPNLTDGSLWIQGYFANQGTSPNAGVAYFAKETIDTSTGSTNFSTREVVVTGGRAHSSNAGYFSGDRIFVDASVVGPPAAGYSGTDMDAGNWQVIASDPWTMTVPAGQTTMSIGGQVFTLDPSTSDKMHLKGSSSLYAPEPGMASLLGIGLLGLLLTGRRRKSD